MIKDLLKISAGKTLKANVALIKSNADLGAKLALELSRVGK